MLLLNDSNNTINMKLLFLLFQIFLLFNYINGSVLLLDNNNVLSLSNNYINLIINKSSSGVYNILCDYAGVREFHSLFSSNALCLESIDSNGTKHSSCDISLKDASIIINSNTTKQASFTINGIVDNINNPLVNETWTFTLNDTSRSINMIISGEILQAQQVAIQHILLAPKANNINAFFNRGVVQMVNAPTNAQVFASYDLLYRVYGLGSNVSYDISINDAKDSKQHVLMTNNDESAYRSLIVGYINHTDIWSTDNLITENSVKGYKYKLEWDISTNNKNFPSNFLTIDKNINKDDVAAQMLAIYASNVGALCTYYRSTSGLVAPSIHQPNTAYGSTYNYFDPDNFFTLSSLMYSGNFYLLEQARTILEKSGEFMLSTGQIPHHFVNNNTNPTYIALSGAEQTGPNIFWTLTAIRYSILANNIPWLKTWLPKLRKSVQFLINFINPKTGLMYVPGSLFIDVFIRNNYTSDSNAMMVTLLDEFSYVEDFFGNSTGSNNLQKLASIISSQMNSMLWSTEDNDHFITQRNTDGSIRDFVDYDANLIAISSGVASIDRAKLILTRIDSGQCANKIVQFVSEKWYGPKDCFGGNVGDSWTAMGRIGYFDALSRKRVKDENRFLQYIYLPLQHDLFEYTYLYERYGCNGLPQLNRTHAYPEYPSLITMLIREVRYGINIGLTNVIIDPFTINNFTYSFGNINVLYSKDYVSINVPGSHSREYLITGLYPNTLYNVIISGGKNCNHSPSSVKTESDGTLYTTETLTSHCIISFQKQ